MEELRALEERANLRGKTQTSDAHTQRYTQKYTQRHTEHSMQTGGAGWHQRMSQKSWGPWKQQQDGHTSGCRQGPSVLEAEKAGREKEEGHWGRESTCISCSLTVILSVTILSQIHDCAFYRTPDVEGKSVPFTTPSCCSSGALPGCLAAFSSHYTK